MCQVPFISSNSIIALKGKQQTMQYSKTFGYNVITIVSLSDRQSQLISLNSQIEIVADKRY